MSAHSPTDPNQTIDSPEWLSLFFPKLSKVWSEVQNTDEGLALCTLLARGNPSQMTITHIQEICRLVPTQIDSLSSLIDPIQSLVGEDQRLTTNVYRVRNHFKQRKPSFLKEDCQIRAWRLGAPRDSVGFIAGSENNCTIHPQPLWRMPQLPQFYRPGLSLSLTPPEEWPGFITKNDDHTLGDNERLFTFFKLKEGTPVPHSLFLENDYDQHVSLSIKESIEAKISSAFNITVNEILELPWENLGYVYHFDIRAAADHWPKWFPGEGPDGHCLRMALNTVLVDGDAQDFFDILRLHSQAKKSEPDLLTRLRLLKTVERILNSFTWSKCYEPNDPLIRKAIVIIRSQITIISKQFSPS